MKQYSKILFFIFTWTASVLASAQTPAPVYRPVENQAICQYHFPYFWRGKQCQIPGTYYDTISDPAGIAADTIYTLQLESSPFTHVHRYVTIPVGGSIRYRGKMYDSAGVYYDTISAAQGCDTLVHLYINVSESYHFYDTLHACDGETHTWRGQTLTRQGTYFDRYKTVSGNDSIYQLNYIVHSSTVGQVWRTVCTSELPIYWNGQTITGAGQYRADLVSPYGCDSTVFMTVSVLPSPAPTYVTEYFCANEGITFKGQHFNTQKIFRDTLVALNGCDSMVVYTFTPKPSQFHETVIQHFAGVPVSWRGKMYSVDGVYTDTLTNRYDCDSIFQLRLVTKYETTSEIYRCEGDTAMVRDRIIDHTCEFRDTLKTRLGGDSIIRYVFNFSKPFHSYETVTLCSNEKMVWAGHKNMVLDKAGIYRDKYHTKAGCDSIYEIEVIMLPAYVKDSTVIRCNEDIPGNPIVWTDSKGITHKFAAPNTDTLIIDSILTSGSLTPGKPMSGGCDSVVRFHAIITDLCVTDSFALCPGGSVTVDGIRYTTTGYYQNPIVSKQTPQAKEPNALHKFEIYAVTVPATYDTLTVCELELPYTYGNTKCQRAGDYTTHFKSADNCDSVVYLHLNVTPTIYAPVEIYKVCPESRFEYKFGGQTITQPGDYYDTIRSLVTGCDSICHLHIETLVSFFQLDTAYIKVGTSYTWHQQGQPRVLTEEGVYFDSCKNVLGCDSVYMLRLLPAKPFYDKEVRKVCSSEFPFLWHGQQIREVGTYYDHLKTMFNMDSTYELVVEKLPSFLVEKQVQLCGDEAFEIRGKKIIGSGIYRDTLFAMSGCDSVTVYYINRTISEMREQSMHIEEGLIYEWHGKQCSEEGMYYDTLRAINGCDSVIYRLNLIVDKSYINETSHVMCGNEDPYEWRGKYYTQTGTYYDRYKSSLGRDSVYVLYLTVHPIFFSTKVVSLCQGDVYPFFDSILVEPGIYRDTLIASTGCDSIYEVIINKAPTSPYVVNHILCPNTHLQVAGYVIDTPGIYRDTLVSVLSGCDSIVHHVVTMGDRFFQNEEKVINPGETYLWHRDGQPWPLNKAGVYFDSCQTTLGCDSIYRLVLTVNQGEYIFPTEKVNVCSSELPYVWRNKSLMATGLYYDSLRTMLGRDSVYSLDLTVLEPKQTHVAKDYCDGDIVRINSRYYDHSVNFIDTLPAANGCDSIIHYQLQFHQGYRLTRLVELRNQDSVILGDTIIRTEGIYVRHLLTSYGCDSIITFRVVRCATPQETTVNLEMCEGDEVYINNRLVTASGTYLVNLLTKDGCDSLVRYQVNVHPSYYFTEKATFCPNSEYTWFGHKGNLVCTQQGLYYDSLTTRDGCDSIYCLQLSHKRRDIIDTTILICEDNLPYHYGGKPYFTSQVFSDTVGLNTEGCDSIWRYHYLVSDHCSDYVQYRFCHGESVFIEGKEYNKDGTYSLHRLTDEGLDSIYRFTVKEAQLYDVTTHLEGCDSVEYKGRTYYARGTGNEKFTIDLEHKTVAGCDSIEHLYLTIYSSTPVHTHYATIADYQSYLFENKYYNHPGTYDVRYTNVSGCDSIERLVLTVLQTTYEPPLTYKVCADDKGGIQVFGKIYHPTENFTISDTISVAGLPVIRTAYIEIEYPFTITSFETLQDNGVCAAKDVLFYVHYTTKDQSALPSHYDVDFLATDIMLTPKHYSGEVGGKTTIPVTLDGAGVCLDPGYYPFRMTLSSPTCTMSDTVIESQVLVRYPESVMQANWGNVVALVNEDYNLGGWKWQPPYVWHVLSSAGDDKTALVATGNPSQPYLYSNYLQEGDRISVTLIREGYNQALPSCELIFQPVVTGDALPILVTPTVAPCASMITLETKSEGTYRLYNRMGHACAEGLYESGRTQLRLPGAAGCYMLLLTHKQEGVQVQKLIVY